MKYNIIKSFAKIVRFFEFCKQRNEPELSDSLLGREEATRTPER